MIEKLEPIKCFNCSDTPQAKMQHHNYHNDCINKINELVDAVNVLQESMDLVQSTLVEEPEPADPYAEQRKWIGKICRFWNDDESLEDSTYGELVNIFDAPHEDCPFQCGYGEWYEHCEPVKPDDDIIYKGGDNEL